jgi:hypothetical protein
MPEIIPAEIVVPDEVTPRVVEHPVDPDFTPVVNTTQRFDPLDPETANAELWERILELSTLGLSPTQIGREVGLKPSEVKRRLDEWSKHWLSHPETMHRNAQIVNDATARLRRIAADAASSARLSLAAGKTTAAVLALAEERQALLAIVKINGAEPAKKTESKNLNVNIGVEALSIDELEQLARGIK